MRSLTLLLLFGALVSSVFAAPAHADQPPFRAPAIGWHKKAKPSRAPAAVTTFALKSITSIEPTVRVLVSGDELDVAQRIVFAGGTVLGYHAGTVHAEVTPEQLRLLADDRAIAGLRLSNKLRPSLDVSRVAIHADAVNSGEGIDRAYTGKGVIVGIVDTGLDVTHPDFKHSDGSTRILSIWDQTVEFSDGSRRPKGFNYGIECTAEHINALLQGGEPLDTCPSDDSKPIDGVPSGGHGTHVAGIIAGSDPIYTGIAPDAVIVGVRAHFEEGSILDGVDYVLGKCEQYERPCVINLSLGTTAGAHDGTALIEQILAQKAGPGKIIVAAAGNEAFPESDEIFTHASIQFTNTQGLIKGPILFPSTEFLSNDDYSLVLDVWSSTTQNHSFYIAAAEQSSGNPLVIHNGFNGASSYLTPPENGDALDEPLKDANGNTWAYVHLITAVDSANNRRETLIAIDRCSDLPCATGGTIDGGVSEFNKRVFILNALNAGTDTLDMWPLSLSAYIHGPVELNFNWPGSAGLGAGPHSFLGGDNRSTITIPGTSASVIAVGSYVTKSEWTGINGIEESFGSPIGSLSEFSSWGPATDGRVKPDITAPGEWIASAKSQGDKSLPQSWQPAEDYIHMTGTSMASPHIAGVVALMLEKNNRLEARNLVGPNGLLSRNIQTSPFTGTLPNPQFGYGIVDVLKIFQDAGFKELITAGGSGPEIKNIKTDVDGSKVTVSWTTDDPSTSGVVLAAEGGGEKRASLKSFVTRHKMTIKNLGENTYRVTVVSTDMAGNTMSRSAGLIETGACGCQSSSGPSAGDILPLLGVVLVWAGWRFRSRVAA